MQRLFSMFPGGLAGVALLILRVCAGGSLFRCSSRPEHFSIAGWPAIGSGIVILLMGLGILTPIACALAALMDFFYLLNGEATDPWQALLGLLITIALGLLGPGAYSVDAKLFGRRLIVPAQD